VKIQDLEEKIKSIKDTLDKTKKAKEVEVERNRRLVKDLEKAKNS